eukprot:g9688.t1
MPSSCLREGEGRARGAKHRQKSVAFDEEVEVLEFSRLLGGSGGVPTDGTWATLGLGEAQRVGVDRSIACETPFALAVVRTQLKGPDDLDRVKEIQKGYKAKPAYRPIERTFEILDFLLSLLPLHGSEMVLRQRLLKLGLGTGSFQLKTSSPELQSALELGMKDGWADFNPSQDGEVLDASKCSYQMVLSKEDQQIAKSFWSLTMYDGKTQLLSENPLKRYLLNSPMLSSMKTAEDRNHRRDETETSASQKQDGTPKSGKRWGGSSMEIPTIQKDLYGPFYLVLRLYLPKVEAYDGTFSTSRGGQARGQSRYLLVFDETKEEAEHVPEKQRIPMLIAAMGKDGFDEVKRHERKAMMTLHRQRRKTEEEESEWDQMPSSAEEARKRAMKLASEAEVRRTWTGSHRRLAEDGGPGGCRRTTASAAFAAADAGEVELSRGRVVPFGTFAGHSDEGPISFKLKKTDFSHFSRISQPVYRFSSYPDDDRFRELVEEALNELGELGSGSLSWTPRKVIDMKGKEVEASLYLGRLIVPRRLRRRDGGYVAEPIPSPVAVSGFPRSGLAPAPEGHMWVALHDTSAFDLGKEANVGLEKGIQLDSDHGAIPDEKGWTLMKLLKVEKVPAMVEEREKLVTSRLELRGVPSRSLETGAKKEEAGGEEDAEVSEDARTLSVCYDDQGERYRSWREATKEAREYSYSDWPLEGPQSVLHLMKYMLKNGGSPKQWLLIWARHKGVHDNDRVMHEMRALLESFELAGCYDQLNLGSLACFEALGRRVQSIVDAYNSGSSASPDWGAAKIMSGYQGPEDLVSPSLRTWAAKKGKEEVEIAAARTKMREHKRLQIPTEDAAASAVADGNLPPGGPAAKAKRKAKAKQLAPPEDT